MRTVVIIQMAKTERESCLNLFTLKGCRYLIGIKVKIARKHIVRKLTKGSVSKI